MDLKQMHYDVMAGKTDYIPLMINMERNDEKPITRWEATYNPQKLIDAVCYNRSMELEFPTDRVVTVESDFQETIIPCMFGATPCEMPDGNIDARPILASIDEAENLQINYEPLERALEHAKYLKANAPDNLNVAVTRFMAPLDYAMVMRGGDFYMDLILEPEKCVKFLNRILDVTLDSIKYLKNAVNEDYREHITANKRGICIRGTRMSGDAFVNLSPAMIEEIVLPLFKRVREELGGLFVHFCTTPFPAWHVMPTLAKNPGIVDGVDNWQGYASFFNNDTDALQDKVSMCFDVDFEQVENIEAFMQLPLFRDVKRNGGRGIFLATSTDDIEKAKRLYDRWRRYFKA